MHWKTKLCLGLTLLSAAVAGALYLSGFLTLTLIGVQTKLTWNLWWLYWQAIALPQYAPYVWKIQLAGAVGFIVPLAAWIAILVPLLKTKPARSTATPVSPADPISPGLAFLRNPRAELL